MRTVFIFYIISQLISTAYGLCIIDVLEPYINRALFDMGYTKKDKNSMYKYNEKIVNFFKGFIPFYYLFQALNLIKGEKPIDREIDKRISSGKYITFEEEKIMNESISVGDTSKNNTLISKIEFEKPEKYTARKIDNTLYDTYITPVEYITVEAKKNEELSLSPFCDPDRVIEHVMVKEDVSNEDIVKAITELSIDELDALNSSISNLKDMKRRQENTLSL